MQPALHILTYLIHIEPYEVDTTTMSDEETKVERDERACSNYAISKWIVRFQTKA